MLIHQQLRQAREEAGLSQAALAAMTGLSRNQIVRAETGENITLETLRKIVTHLPIDELTLMERVKIKMDYLNPAEKMFFGIGETLAHLMEATQSALTLAVASRGVLALARIAEAQAMGEEPEPDTDTETLLENVTTSIRNAETLRRAMFDPEMEGSKAEGEGSKAENSGSKAENTALDS